MAYIFTNEDLPENPLFKEMDHLLARCDGTTREEMCSFFGVTDDGGDLWLFGASLVVRYTGTSEPIRYRQAPKQKSPSIMEMMKNAAEAAARTVAAAATSGQVLAPAPVVAARKAICEACPHFKDNRCMDVIEPNTVDADGKVIQGKVLRGCGCNLPAKTRLAAEKCPQDKWGPVVALNSETPSGA
jgi:hypothetical protein